MLPKLTLILGGTASGKSFYAETLAQKASNVVTYIATAQSLDKEMAEKINRHKKQRIPTWQTIEEPFDLVNALQKISGNVILIECATLWLTNLFLNKKDNLITEKKKLLSTLKIGHIPVIIVSNEVGCGIVPSNILSREFRQEQGQLNAELASQADLVIFVTAGLPHCLKGSLP
ncbi:MAG: bifunctional adenosylcobinamide kinase/adenosylcobinamide-phosphate guanylyltransferase [Aestuariivita sp.]|nr:bifunctional adenosylcobinamide kinase/adenosylcobinamide-phosphate guanylyltransferase [Aestuariivita sp.]